MKPWVLTYRSRDSECLQSGWKEGSLGTALAVRAQVLDFELPVPAYTSGWWPVYISYTAGTESRGSGSLIGQ